LAAKKIAHKTSMKLTAESISIARKVSLAIRGVNVPDKSQAANTRINIFGLP